jgi:hypothetical protein
MDLERIDRDDVSIGAYWDRGVAASSGLFEIVVRIDGLVFLAGPKDIVDILISQSKDGINFDGQPTTAPTETVKGTMTSRQAFNALYCGTVQGYAGAPQIFQSRFIIRLTERYAAPIMIVGVDPKATTASHGTPNHTITITPIPQEGQ